MNHDENRRTAKGAADTVQLTGRTAREFQELWLNLAQRNWKSLVLVPVDPDLSVMQMAKALADIGGPLSESPVTAVSLVDALDVLSPDNAGTDRARTKTIVNRIRSLRQGDAGQLIIAIQPVTVEPLGVLVTRAADVVVLCIQMKHSRSEAVRRTQSLIGADRIAGCLVLE
ncbi:MAG: hypothetical protein WBV82_10915 [Myxococcaceae bacterium]